MKVTNTSEAWLEAFMEKDPYLNKLSDWHRNLLFRYAVLRQKRNDILLSRAFSYGLMLYQKRYNKGCPIPNKLVNYLYYQ